MIRIKLVKDRGKDCASIFHRLARPRPHESNRKKVGDLAFDVVYRNLYSPEGYTFELLVYSRVVASVAIRLSSAHVNMNYCIPTVHLYGFSRPSR